jgi:hypothetical protein
MAAERTLDAYVAALPDGQREIAEAVRRLVRKQPYGLASSSGPSVTPASCIARLKLPNLRRIVFSDGLMPDAIHDAWVGNVAC